MFEAIWTLVNIILLVLFWSFVIYVMVWFVRYLKAKK